MTMTTPVAELLFTQDNSPISSDEATLKPWDQARTCLESAPKAWLSTVRADGRPHTMPVLLVLVDGHPCLTTRPTSLKGRNLARNTQCVITIGSETLDLVVEGEAARIHDQTKLHQMAAAFKAKYEWELAVRDGSVYEDNLPGTPEYGFYQLTPTRAYGYGADGMTATRWRFA
jgi:hypothetical protein